MRSACPICRKSNYTIKYDLLQVPAILIVKCDHCSCIYTIQKNEPGIEELYTHEVYEVVENRHSIFDKILNWEYGRVVKRIDTLKKTKGSLLDFGSGKGKFADLAKKRQWQVRCVETAEARADYARKIYGLEVDTRFYTGGKLFNNEFDVITLFHVLEHLPDPQNLLNELIQCNLVKGGVVVIEVPNIKSLQAYIAGRKWIHLDASRHKSHFTHSQIEQLARRAGLICRKTTFFSFHLGVLGMTDTFLKLFGYKGNIIYELKNKKSIGLRLAIFILLPLMITLEFSSALFKRGGVIREYFVLPRKRVDEKKRLKEENYISS